jgi:hypothetical protein
MNFTLVDWDAVKSFDWLTDDYMWLCLNGKRDEETWRPVLFVSVFF